MTLQQNLQEYERLLREHADLDATHADLSASAESNLKFPVGDEDEVERARRRGELLGRLHREGVFSED